MLREDLEIALKPAGCAIAFPKRYERHNKVLENEHNSDFTLGIGVLQACSSGWDVALKELPKSKVSADPRPTLKCRKRNKSPNLVLDNGQENPNNKKKKGDNSVVRSRESRVFRNSQMKKFKKKILAKDDETGESLMSPDREKRKLKRKAEKCSPHAADELMNIVDVQNDDNKVKNPPKKRHSKKTRRNKKSLEERSLEDELMTELENFHIGSNSNVSTETLSAAPKNLKRKHRNSQLNATPTTGSDVLDVNHNTFNLKKLVKWTKRHWNKDQKGATLASSLNSSVEVHNLPAVMSLVFQQLLFEVFDKYGQITHVGPVVMHQSAEGECTFSTTIYFETETAATKNDFT
ncbi:uncharacterized protein LOC134804528 [Cydia splendana]|uniref:uncharacterized protein LOC134804528 n=1 Tax=Cydia splendana TaxID=1100963 RepID=UPI00300CCA29